MAYVQQLQDELEELQRQEEAIATESGTEEYNYL